MNIIKEGYPSFIMNIIKEGYPSDFSNFSDSIIAYLESFLTIFLLLTNFQFLQKTRERIKLSLFNNFKLEWKQVDEKNFRCFMIQVTIKFLRCTCLLEYSDEVKSLKIAINLLACNILSPIIHTLKHHCLPIYRIFLLKILFQFEFGDLFPDCKSLAK